MKKRICALLLSALCIISLVGCGSDNELDKYRKSVEAFYKDVTEINDNINAIDAESENAPQLLLDELDELEVKE